jgi:hypothetical protein
MVTYIQNKPLYRDLRAWSLFLIASGTSLVFFPQRFDVISSYRVILDIFSTSVWGILFMLAGLVTFLGIHSLIKRLNYNYVRAALVVSASIEAMFGIGIIIAYIFGSNSTPYGLLIYFLLLYIPFSLLKRDPLVDMSYRAIP